MNFHTTIAWILVASVVACSSDDSGDDGSGPEGTTDTTGEGRDSGTRDTSSEDTSSAEDTSAADSTPAPDVEPGDGGFGTLCTEDGDCESGLCLSTQYGDVCTVACDEMADCELAGLNCVEIREGVTGCAPDQTIIPNDCTDHLACPYPYYCQSEFSWCALPQCTWGADCDSGEMCQPLVRRCQPETCITDVDCKNPAEVCNDGDCGPPECTDSSQCDGIDYCSLSQQRCRTPNPCGEEDSCPYSEQCESGYCYPNPCHAGCTNPGHSCDPSTGHCGTPCTSNGNCSAGEACSTVSGLCYDNELPFADAVAVIDGSRLTAANVTVGSSITLSGEGSVDPEREPLSYRWVINAVPSGSSLVPGSTLGADATVNLAVDAPGIFAIGLWVSDPGELFSVQDQVVLWAR